MVKKIIKWIITLLGFVSGYQLARFIISIEPIQNYVESITDLPYALVINIIGGILFGVIFYLLSPFFINTGLKLSSVIEGYISKLTFTEILTTTFALMVGLIIAALISIPISAIEFLQPISQIVIILIYIFFGYLGITIANKNADTFSTFFKKVPKEQKTPKSTKNLKRYKVLDTSVIIDGRIFDICKTGFIEGTIVIPQFVLAELQYIADSSDSLKRNRGRRGLDVINKIQKELPIEVINMEKDYPDISEVDAKLLKLTEDLKGIVVTNDYNLNKVATIKGIEVLNINELANAVKPVVLPGEEMVVNLIKEGKENGQGVAYLDDGTMIVVENGKKYVGETIEVTVTSVLQTAAGRMIFAKPKKVVSKSI